MERKRYFTLEQTNKMIKEQNKRIKIELVKENVYLKDLLMQQKEVLDKALCWLCENTHYTDFNVNKLILDENVNLKELLELLEENICLMKI